MTHRARKDAIKQAAGERKAQAYRAIRWAEQQMETCTSDAMLARLMEETIRRANERARDPALPENRQVVARPVGMLGAYHRATDGA